jgi:hypothetical protein
MLQITKNTCTVKYHCVHRGRVIVALTGLLVGLATNNTHFIQSTTILFDLGADREIIKVLQTIFSDRQSLYPCN